MSRKRSRFQNLADGELIDLLYTAGDRLPREAVDQVIARGRRLLPHLRDLVADKGAWTQPLPEWWAVVHATYCLGALEHPDTLPALLCALRWADAFDCDWVTDDLPSMFRCLGAPAYEPLRAIQRDWTAGPGARSVALNGMAAVTLAVPHLRDGALTTAAELLADGAEDLYLRQTAANVLLDFHAQPHRELLLGFGREEAARKREDPEYQAVVFDWEVDELLAGEGDANLDYYQRDWLAFYDPEEMERRQERWSRELEEAEQAQDDAPPSARRDLRDPCPCGSGRPFAHCCYLKVH